MSGEDRGVLRRMADAVIVDQRRRDMELELELLQARERTAEREHRGPGRPPWTRDRFHAAYRRATDGLGPDPSDAEIADRMGYADTRQLGRLVTRFGRPLDTKPGQ